MKNRCLVTFAFLLVVGSISFATESLITEGHAQERGRLSDGRAYRTTEDGTQLVDYIAELELNVEQLKRQILGLEDENKARRDKIERLERSGKKDSGVFERNLVTSDLDKGTAPKNCPVAEIRYEKVLDPSLCSKTDGAKEYINLKHELEELKVRRERARAQYEDEMATLRTKLIKKDNALVKQNAVLQEREQEITRLKNAEQENDSRAQMAPITEPISMASTAKQPELRTRNTRTVEKAPTRTQLSPARLQALAAVRSSVQSDVNKLRGLISSRDQRFKRYKKGNQGSLGFRMSKLVSARNYNVSKIKSELASAKSLRELSGLKKDVQQIRAKVQDDLALIGRMTKMRS